MTDNISVKLAILHEVMNKVHASFQPGDIGAVCQALYDWVVKNDG